MRLCKWPFTLCIQRIIEMENSFSIPAQSFPLWTDACFSSITRSMEVVISRMHMEDKSRREWLLSPTESLLYG